MVYVIVFSRPIFSFFTQRGSTVNSILPSLEQKAGLGCFFVLEFESTAG